MTPKLFQRMAAYNAWMNENIYNGCAGIPDADRKKDMGAFFTSIHGTLNHLVVGDMAWMSRFQKTALPPYKMNAIVYENFDDLWAARRKLDADITAFAAGLTDDAIAAPFRFISMTYNREITGDMWMFVMHMFNHQTHHRGQITTLMKQCGVDPGPTDLPVMPL
jgi:uncharacterized damage-inducible protein DinB